jgi:hypothetical protein
MKMILSSLNLVRKVGVCITSEENSHLNNSFTLKQSTTYLLILKLKTLLFALIETPDPENSKNRGVK